MVAWAPEVFVFQRDRKTVRDYDHLFSTLIYAEDFFSTFLGHKSCIRSSWTAESKMDSSKKEEGSNGCIIAVSQMRTVRLSEVKYHLHTILMTTQLGGWLQFVPRSVWTKACVYCIMGKGEGGKRGGAIKKENWEETESQRWGSHVSPPPAGLTNAPGPLKGPTVTVWFSSSLLLGTRTFSFVRRKQWLSKAYKNSWTSTEASPNILSLHLEKSEICFLPRQSSLPDILIYKWTENKHPAVGWTPDIGGRR